MLLNSLRDGLLKVTQHTDPVIVCYTDCKTAHYATSVKYRTVRLQCV